MPSCPRGHDTVATDYCDECGSPIGVPASHAAASPAWTGDEPCPECGTRSGRFCEACGRDRGETAGTSEARAASAPDMPTATGTPNGWLIVAWANRDYHAHMRAKAPQFAEVVDIPDTAPKRHFVLNGSQLLIGRRSQSRGIEPDIDLTGPPEDPGISHTHALLVANQDGGWSLVDIQSANGTYLNGQDKPIEANQPVPLTDGDQIHLGAWTTLTLRSRSKKRQRLPR